MIRVAIVIAAALAFAATLPAALAQAQALRTFVSAAGSDSNNCANVATPCRHFQTAVNATAAGGEVVALDPANYGSITISQAISIDGQGWAHITPPDNGNAITVNAHPTEIINIRGVALNGSGIPMADGIQFNVGATLNVQSSVIRGFQGGGIVFTPQSVGQAQIFVSNTLLSDNGLGIQIAPLSPVKGALDHVVIENNGGNGLNVVSAIWAVNLTVSDSVCANNRSNGIAALTSGVSISVMVRNSTIANNDGDGLLAQNTGAVIRVTRSTITGNTAGWGVSSGGVVSTFGDNDIIDNGSANSAPSSINHE